MCLFDALENGIFTDNLVDERHGNRIVFLQEGGAGLRN